MGLTPGPDGLLPEPDVLRLKEWGEEIERRFSDPVQAISGEGFKIEIKFGTKQNINHFVLQEDITYGERVREFKVEVLMEGKWESLVEGSVIGHKFIHAFNEVVTNRIRLTIGKAVDTPKIKNFAVYLIN